MQRLIHDEQNDRRANRATAPSEARAQAGASELVADDLLTQNIASETNVSEYQQQRMEARRRSRARALLIQPPLYWSVLMVVAAATGMLSVYNPSVRQPILLHTIPLALTFLAGYRLKDPKQGALSGALFHVARAALILGLSAGPQFMRVLENYPGQLLWLFLLLPAVGWIGGVVGQRQKTPSAGGARAGAAAMAAGLIALTTVWITPRFLNPPTPGLAQTIPGDLERFAGRNLGPGATETAALTTPVINTGNVKVGDGLYAFEAKFLPEASWDLSNIAVFADEMVPGTTIPSADGSAQLTMNDSGLQWTKDGQAPRQIASAENGPISHVSTSADGNMTIFQQGGGYMVNTPSKGTRPLEDLLRQFGDGLSFKPSDGSVVEAGWDAAGRKLSGRLADPISGDPIGFEYNLTPR